ncbi:MAG: [FeFe] hydrogenase H-cluster radical SAM maturase HydE, partial [Planctomycetota bacterium]
EHLARVVAKIRAHSLVAVTLSVGVKPAGACRLWSRAGADRYLLKYEVADSALYAAFHPDSSLYDRLSALARLRSFGYQIGGGNIIGLPGQSLDDLLDDICLAHELDLDMAAFGPFVPHADTPLAGAPPGDIELALRVVAVARLVLGPVHIPATTAFDSLAPDGRERALRMGANVVMANITPVRYRDLYEIYPGRARMNSVEHVRAMLDRIGRPAAADCGHSLRWTKVTSS